VRSDRATAGLQLAKAQLRQLLQDVAMVDPGTGHSDALLSHGAIGPGLCLDLSTRDSWSSASPLVRLPPPSPHALAVEHGAWCLSVQQAPDRFTGTPAALDPYADVSVTASFMPLLRRNSQVLGRVQEEQLNARHCCLPRSALTVPEKRNGDDLGSCKYRSCFK
jgi:hypothetical protein